VFVSLDMYVLMLVTSFEFGHVYSISVSQGLVVVISTATHCKYKSVSMFLLLTEVSNDSRFSTMMR
jgi:hypothetical protein